MRYIQSHSGNSEAVQLYCEEWGQGNPIVLIHGWPLTHDMWTYQFAELPKHGFRVIAYDRRGFGKSSRPWSGYDYDTLADDLKAVLDELDLHEVTLVGFSMGGGEVARYMSRHHGARVAKVAFIGAVTPFLLKTPDNPAGLDQSMFDQLLAGLNQDRPDFLASFGKAFYGVGMIHHPVKQAMLDWSFSMAMTGLHQATIECAKSWSATDFREDLKTIRVPALIVHGDGDQTVPLEISGALTAKAIPGSQFKVYEGAPHGLMVTHKDQLNADLVAFAGPKASWPGPTF
jgi:non-heme chloroperoxidase